MSCVLDCANKWLAPAALGCTRAVDVVSRGMDRDIFGRKLSRRISGTVVAMAPTVPSPSFFFFFSRKEGLVEPHCFLLVANSAFS